MYKHLDKVLISNGFDLSSSFVLSEKSGSISSGDSMCHNVFEMHIKKDGNVVFMEGCDQTFSATASPEKMIEMLLELVSAIKDNTGLNNE